MSLQLIFLRNVSSVYFSIPDPVHSWRVKHVISLAVGWQGRWKDLPGFTARDLGGEKRLNKGLGWVWGVWLELS